MKYDVKKLTRAALLLSICVTSQLLKNVSAYITGTVVNATLVLAGVFCGAGPAAAIAVVSPLTSWLITGSPVLSAMPVIVPCIMTGNLVMALSAWLSLKKGRSAMRLAAGTVTGALVKSAFMWLLIVKVILRIMGPDSGLPEKALNAASVSFSVTQLATAIIGSAVAVAVYAPLQKTVKME